MDVDGYLDVFVTGGAGSGKTLVLKLLVEQIRRLGHDNLGKGVIVTTPTGVADRHIRGSTLHFSPAYRKGQNRSFKTNGWRATAKRTPKVA